MSTKPIYFGTKHDGRFIVIDRQRIDKEELDISPHDTIIEVYSNGRPVSEAVHIIDPNAPRWTSEDSGSGYSDLSTAWMIGFTLLVTVANLVILLMLWHGAK